MEKTQAGDTNVQVEGLNFSIGGKPPTQHEIDSALGKITSINEGRIWVRWGILILMLAVAVWILYIKTDPRSSFSLLLAVTSAGAFWMFVMPWPKRDDNTYWLQPILQQQEEFLAMISSCGTLGEAYRLAVVEQGRKFVHGEYEMMRRYADAVRQNDYEQRRSIATEKLYSTFNSGGMD